MKIVIDISENDYEMACRYPDALVYAHAIKNGTPLPKGHGRLIDADLLSTIFTEQYPKNYMNKPELSGTAAHFSLRHILQILNSESCVPTIIEADKAKSDASNFESEEYIEQRLENYDKLLKSGMLDCVIDEVTGKRE